MNAGPHLLSPPMQARKLSRVVFLGDSLTETGFSSMVSGETTWGSNKNIPTAHQLVGQFCQYYCAVLVQSAPSQEAALPLANAVQDVTVENIPTETEVPRRGLEPPRPKGTGPQPAAYANSATGAHSYYSRFIPLVNSDNLT